MKTSATAPIGQTIDKFIKDHHYFLKVHWKRVKFVPSEIDLADAIIITKEELFTTPNSQNAAKVRRHNVICLCLSC